MEQEEILWFNILIAALFLRSDEHPGELHRREAGRVMRAMAEGPGNLTAFHQELQLRGLWQAAARLARKGLIAWAEALVEDQRVLTLLDAEYPERLRRVLGDSAPAAFWRSGRLASPPDFSMSGSRQPSDASRQFGLALGEEIGRRNLAMISGGAEGCDLLVESSAVRSGASAIRILPFGLAHGRWPDYDICQLTLAPPREPFSTANAMERNLLIHSASPKSVVVHARFREGGTWHGVQDAMRRKVTRFFAYQEDSGPFWSKALVHLGASPVTSPEQIWSEVSPNQAWSQPRLTDGPGAIRERAAAAWPG